MTRREATTATSKEGHPMLEERYRPGKISNVILEEKDPSFRKQMIHWLERGMKKDSEENLVNNKNDFPHQRINEEA